MKTSKFYLWTLSLLLCLSSNVLFAKKVICIDGGGDGFLNLHEKYERDNAGPNDVIVVGGNLADCMMQAQNGDTLIIVAHGHGPGEGFKWGGVKYTGFGMAGDAMQGTNPYPLTAAQKAALLMRQLHVDFCTCWSTKDPDGAGPKKSPADKLKLILKAGTTVNGFTDYATLAPTVRICASAGVSRAQILKKLKDTSGQYINCPPANRPNVPSGTSIEAKMQAILIQCFGFVPLNGEGPQLPRAFLKNVGVTTPYNSTVIAPGQGGIAGGCGCPDQEGSGGCGLVQLDIEIEDALFVPAFDKTIFPCDIYDMEEPLGFFPLEGGRNVQIMNLRWFNAQPGLPMPQPDVGQVYEMPIQAQSLISIDGQPPVDVQYEGVAAFQIFAFDDCNFQLQTLGMNLSPALLGFPQIETIPFELPGALNFHLVPTDLPDQEPLFHVDSFYETFMQISLDGNPYDPQPVLMRAVSPGPQPGCTDPSASNYVPSAFFSDNTCLFGQPGCTYEAAFNFDPLATIDDGNCIYPGCFDSSALNFSPFYNFDNEDCLYPAAVCAPDNCASDVNGDMQISIPDLLQVVSTLGTLCPPQPQ